MQSDHLTAEMRARSGFDWCLFLDRDGVINTRIVDGYVRSWAEFEFIPGVLDAIRTLSRWAPRIVVVTNQQGVGRGIMTPSDLTDIHERMRRAVTESGGRIDAIQSCPHLALDACECRKPKIGMPQEYLSAHPEVDASLSVMIGDTESDVEMGRRLALVTGGGMTVRIDRADDPRADLTFPTLAAFAAAVAAEDGGDEDQSAE